MYRVVFAFCVSVLASVSLQAKQHNVILVTLDRSLEREMNAH